MTNLQWRIFHACLTVNPKTGMECQRERGHTGDHIATEWKDGEIVGPIYWQQAKGITLCE